MRLIDADAMIRRLERQIGDFEMRGSVLAQHFYIPYFKAMIEELRREPSAKDSAEMLREWFWKTDEEKNDEKN